MTMGEATMLTQGYATQVWIPEITIPTTRDIVALLHDRSKKNEDSGIFFMPGNRVSRLFEQGAEEHELEDGSKLRHRIRIPDAVLWENHGGPCTARGAEYYQIREEIFKRVLGQYVIQKDSNRKAIIVPGSYLGTSIGFHGPYDYRLPQTSTKIGIKPYFQLMDPSLL